MNGARNGVAGTAPGFGIYVHIPFCTRVCPYCDFNVYAGADDLAPAYMDAMLTEARAWPGPFEPAGSIFIGGGTPSLIEPALLARFLDELRSVFDVADDAEITMEANPEDVTVDRLRVLRDAGVNRLSLGAQSFVPSILVALGRVHSPERARAAVASARDAGFDNVSLDLIFGAPGETNADWLATLERALQCEPDHVSAYSLTIEEGTAFGAAVKAGRMAAPLDDDQAAKYEAACDALDPIGHYEISNWGRPSAHNLLYWTQGDYVGLGAGAHSHVDGVRSWNIKRPAAYIERARDPRGGSERLDAAARAEEWLQLRLRLVEGFDLSESAAVLGRDLRPPANELATAGLATISGDRFALTRRGLLLENEVALRLGA